MTRVLITGATGFLGGAVAQRMTSNGATVRALVRASSNRSGLERLGAEFALGDVTDAPSIAKALNQVDLVIHCAAMVSFDPADESRLRDINVEGTRHVLSAAAERDLPAVHVSSTAALGETLDEIRDESWWNPAQPDWAYEQTKREAHEIATDLVSQGADVRLAIPGGIYGPGDDSDLARSIRFYLNSPVSIGLLPSIRHSTVHVDDCATGVQRLADRGAAGDTYLLCAETVTMSEWITLMRRAAGRRPPRFWVSAATIQRLIRVTDSAAGLANKSAGRLTGTARMAMRNFAFLGQRARDELEWTPRPLLVGMRELAILPGG